MYYLYACVTPPTAHDKTRVEILLLLLHRNGFASRSLPFFTPTRSIIFPHSIFINIETSYAHNSLISLKIQLNPLTSNSITNGSCLLFILFDLQASTSTASLPPLLTPHCPQNFSKAMEEAFSGAAPSDPATSLQSRPHQLS